MANPLDGETGDALGRLCSKYAVKEQKLFGSATGDGFDVERSDIDLLVQFDPAPAGVGFARQFFGVHKELTSLFGRRVDLVEERAIKNVRFKQNALEGAVRLYAA